MMRNQFNEIMQKLRAQRVRARRYTAMLLVLAMLTSLSVSWRLHQVGTALTTDNEYCCGMEEHVHTDDCYTEELVCGYEEGEPEDPDSAFSVDSEPTTEEPEAEPEELEPEETEPEVHHHTADCYETVLVEHKELTCGQEEHTHDVTCPVDPDTGDFLCGFEEHTHTDDCYTTETETEEKLVCGYEEGEVLSDGTAADDDGIAALEDTNTATSVAEEDSSSEAVSEPVLHHHTEACYEKVLTCTIPEHTHTLECLADYSADVETDDDWEKYSVGLSDNWNEALLAVAQEQLGYKESEKNFQTDEALGDIIDVHHYTRYGAFYGNPYADWDVAFIAFCQHYAGIPKTEIPQRLGLEALRADMDAMGFAYLTEGEEAAYEAIPGDVVTYNKNGTADDETIGIVETVGDDSLTVISGAVEGAVAEVTVPFTDVTSTILVDQAYSDYVGEPDDPDGDYDDEIAVQPAEEKDAAAVDSGGTPYPIDLGNEEVAKKLDAHFELQKMGSDNLYHKVTGNTVNEGDDLRVVVNITAPADTFSKTKENGNKLTYTLPFKLQKQLENKEIYKKNSSDVIGYLNADTDGNVTVEFFTNDIAGFDCEGEVQAEFKVWGNAVAKGTGENQIITFPGDNGSFTLKKKSDISVKKEAAADIIEEGGKTYFKYTITVSSNNGTAGETVDIRDQITYLYKLTGQFDKDSFELKKNDGDVSNLKSYLKMTTDESGRPGFTMSALPPLEAGESYTLTYRYEITNANELTANDYGEVGNKAYAKYGNHDEKGTIEIKKGLYGDGLIIKKTGGYSGNGKTDLAHGRIKWQVDIQNPSGNDLKGYVVTDTIRSGSDAVIREQNGVEVYVSQDGSNYSTYIVNNKAEKGTVTDGKKGFTYTFPDGSTGKNYRFIYYTTNPTLKAGETTTVENDVTAERGGEKYTGEGKVTVEAREGLLIKAPNGKTLDVVDLTKLKKDWSIAVRTAAETDAGKTFTIKDTFQPPKVNESESATLKHYAIKSVLDRQLRAGMNLYWVSGDRSNQESLSTVLNRFSGVSVTFKYYKEDGKEALNEDDHVTSFEITVDWKNADPNLIITQLNADNYTSYIEDISSLKAGDTVKATNKIECEESKKQPTEVTNSYTKPEPEKPKKPDLRKLVATDSMNGPYDFEDNTATIRTGTPNGTVIWFKLLIKHPNADTVTVTDTLPKGLKYVEAKNTDNTLNWQDSYRVGTTKDDRKGIAESDLWAKTSQPNTDVFQLTTSMNENGQQVLTFTLSGLDKKDLTNVDVSIIYGVKVEDDYWNDISNDPSKDYPNEAKWGKLKKSATATVTRTNFETQKGVNYDPKTQTATYTVTINEQSKQLLPYEGGYLKLEDILTVPPGLSATLDQNSIVVRNEHDEDVTKDALGPCNIDPDTHTMKIEIKDGKKYKLSYTYKFVPHEGLPSGQTLTVTNEVKMCGHIASNKDMEFHNGGGSGSASNGVTDILTLVKSEKGKNNNTLGGVTFELSEYGENRWTPVGTHTTESSGDAKGTITFRYNARGESAEGTVKVNADTLYRLVETQTANDYILDDTPHYFVMLSQGATADEVYPNFSGSGAAKNDIKFVSAGQTTDVLKVENEARKIKVEKVWKDADGNPMAAPQSSITVTLQRKVGDAVDNDFSEKLTLTQGNGWKVTYPDTGSLPETDKFGHTYYYFVTEDSNSVPNGYNVMYSYVDKNGATQSEHGVTAGGTATITNQKKTNWLNVTKVWQDSDGKPLTENLPEITVHLYKVVSGQVEATSLSLRLNAGNNWTSQFTNLDPNAQYYVVEDTVEGYTVSYTKDAENPAAPGATITVINRKNAPGYELPATGSTGTAPYTTAGAVLMGAALVGGYRRKRRQERRGE
jgi:LPXTG-motif cell wall-anchored protein